ncbi:uncharacterized protein UBRO2_04449 [Ustilago bromivora]|uniref:Pectate lyase n=1 Tax=Ustilago bromivora TaxID=307758 RepID=A0A8H8QQQ0_9BASI|nr:uncharacterized protein UBRO2_04449 [Ustilago bromivora]
MSRLLAYVPSLALLVALELLLLIPVQAQFFQQFFGGGGGGSMFGHREQEPPPIRCSYKDTDSISQDQAKRAGGTFDGVDAALDLGGTFCVTADSCDEVNKILHAKA